MKPTLLTALLATSLSTACAIDDGAEDELAGESDQDGETGKGDAADAFTYFQVTPDARACSLDADCGGFFVSRVNRASTECKPGSSSSSCYVGAIDWARTQLAGTAALESKLREGTPILVRGEMGIDTGARIAEKLASNVGALIAPMQPMVDLGGGPDCLYNQVTITDVKATRSSITVSPTNEVIAVFDGITLTGTSKFAVACVNGTSQVEIKVAHAEVMGPIVNGVFTTPTASATGVTYTAPQMPSAVHDFFRFDAAAMMSETTAVAVNAVAALPVGPALLATEVWMPGSATGTADGVFVLAKDNGIRCITSPCPSLGETRLNANRSAVIDTIDFEASGADAATIEAASADLFDAGVLVAGYRYYPNGGKGRRANQFWTKVR